MTHDELLEELDEVIKDFDQKYDNSNPYYKALRAVVELHKPREEVTGINDRGDVLSSQTICNICTGLGAFSTKYPCPTIKALEKELL
jgi:hypothetical protein